MYKLWEGGLSTPFQDGDGWWLGLVRGGGLQGRPGQGAQVAGHQVGGLQYVVFHEQAGLFRLAFLQGGDYGVVPGHVLVDVDGQAASPGHNAVDAVPLGPGELEQGLVARLAHKEIVEQAVALIVGGKVLLGGVVAQGILQPFQIGHVLGRGRELAEKLHRHALQAGHHLEYLAHPLGRNLFYNGAHVLLVHHVAQLFQLEQGLPDGSAADLEALGQAGLGEPLAGVEPAGDYLLDQLVVDLFPQGAAFFGHPGPSPTGGGASLERQSWHASIHTIFRASAGSAVPGLASWRGLFQLPAGAAFFNEGPLGLLGILGVPHRHGHLLQQVQGALEIQVAAAGVELLGREVGQRAHLADLLGRLLGRGGQLVGGHYLVYHAQVIGPLQIQRLAGEDHLRGHGPGHVVKDKGREQKGHVAPALGQAQLGVVRGQADVALQEHDQAAAVDVAVHRTDNRLVHLIGVGQGAVVAHEQGVAEAPLTPLHLLDVGPGAKGPARALDDGHPEIVVVAEVHPGPGQLLGHHPAHGVELLRLVQGDVGNVAAFFINNALQNRAPYPWGRCWDRARRWAGRGPGRPNRIQYYILQASVLSGRLGFPPRMAAGDWPRA
eukprot:TRINITY_DN29020_c0_g1_i1.p2 TRINITY_DN29020_c0_g1~~TRINITY_DN29020_c0_g1_i1.p2  ORF type:complete len:605 (-),score=145.47 TRINITY_DN29020_c0_g1_i1:908-2722(-)